MKLLKKMNLIIVVSILINSQVSSCGEIDFPVPCECVSIVKNITARI